jgi:hypothetical protein
MTWEFMPNFNPTRLIWTRESSCSSVAGGLFVRGIVSAAGGCSGRSGEGLEFLDSALSTAADEEECEKSDGQDEEGYADSNSGLRTGGETV